MIEKHSPYPPQSKTEKDNPIMLKQYDLKSNRQDKISLLKSSTFFRQLVYNYNNNDV